MTTLNRRAVASGALALSAILVGTNAASMTHSPTSMLEARHPDSDISALFVQWVRAMDAGLAEAKASDYEDGDFEDAADAIKARTCTLHATTVEGLAIKAYLSAHHELGHDQAAGINWDGGLMVDPSPHRSLIGDAVQLSPALPEAGRPRLVHRYPRNRYGFGGHTDRREGANEGTTVRPILFC